jgi:SAM-dependent methyltransferase
LIRIAVISFLILYLELVCIRWLGAEMKLFAYFKNFVLMASFAGLGLGCAMPVSGEPRNRWLPWTILALVLVCTTATLTGFALAFFPDAGVFQWNGSLSSPDLQRAVARRLPAFAGAQSAVAFRATVTAFLLAFTYGILAIVGASFYGLGRALSFAFDGEPPLSAYTANVAGSLAGTIVAAGVAWIAAPPVVWIAIVAAAVLVTQTRARKPAALAMGLAIAAAGYHYVSHRDQIWSPYYQIEVEPFLRMNVDGRQRDTAWLLNVNHSAFQEITDLSPAAMALYRQQIAPAAMQVVTGPQLRHELPFRLTPSTDRALVIGAGGGNDVAAGLRLGARHIDAVDIDPAILGIGRRLHPENPYGSDRVRVITNDARAFVDRTAERYDLIVFGTLDSQSAVSAQSSLRLEYFVYTEESFRHVAKLLKPDGLLVVAFGTSWRPWVTERIATTMRNGLGVPIRALQLEAEPGRTFFVAGPGAGSIDWTATEQRLALRDVSAQFAQSTVRPSTDDWPYLYMDPQRFPWVLTACAVFNVVVAVGLLRWLSRRRGGTHAADTRTAAAMFLMGAGFMLVETKSLTELALVFGGTWIVNAIAFTAIFIFILGANAYVARRPGLDARAALTGVIATLVLKYVFSAQLAAWSSTQAGRIAAPLVACGPMFFASVGFARLFSGVQRAGAALGWNIVGGLAGGGIELVAIFLGNRALNIVAALIYGAVLITAYSRRVSRSSVAARIAG